MKLGYKELRIVKSTTVHQEFRVSEFSGVC
jgi:hypothetical protein